MDCNVYILFFKYKDFFLRAKKNLTNIIFSYVQIWIGKQKLVVTQSWGQEGRFEIKGYFTKLIYQYFVIYYVNIFIQYICDYYIYAFSYFIQLNDCSCEPIEEEFKYALKHGYEKMVVEKFP